MKKTLLIIILLVVMIGTPAFAVDVCEWCDGYADAGGPYSFYLGDDLTLTGNGWGDLTPDTGSEFYSWDLDNDGQYDDAIGQTVNLIPGDILFPTAGVYTIRLEWYGEQNGIYGFCALGYDDTTVTALVSSVPEPATLLLLGLGLIGATGFRKKFKE